MWSFQNCTDISVFEYEPPSFSRGTPPRLVDSGQSTERSYSYCHEDMCGNLSATPPPCTIFQQGKETVSNSSRNRGTPTFARPCQTPIQLIVGPCSSLCWKLAAPHWGLVQETDVWHWVSGGRLGHCTQWGADHQGHSCLWPCGQEFHCYWTVQHHGANLTWAQTGWL